MLRLRPQGGGTNKHEGVSEHKATYIAITMRFLQGAKLCTSACAPCYDNRALTIKAVVHSCAGHEEALHSLQYAYRTTHRVQHAVTTATQRRQVHLQNPQLLTM